MLSQLEQGVQNGHVTNNSSFEKPGNVLINHLSSLVPPKNTVCYI